MAMVVHQVISVLLLGLLTLRVASSEQNILKQAFSVASRLYVSIPDSAQGLETPAFKVVDYTEYYSPAQQRAKIFYHIYVKRLNQLDVHKGANYFRFLLDKKRGTALEMSDQFKCEPMGVADFKKKSSLEQLDLGIADDELILGPSKLLVLVDNSRNLLKPGDLDIQVRRLHSELYILKIDSRLTLHVHFAKAADKDSLDVFPLRIVVVRPNVPEVIVDYQQPVRLHPYTSRWTDTNQMLDTYITDDTFAYDPHCMDHLKKSSVRLFPDKSSAQFSFKAIVEHPVEYGYEDSNVFVAFDAELESMRVDKKNKRYGSEWLISFNLQRLYDTSQTISEHYCRISPLRSDEKPMTVGRLIAGGEDDAVYLGKALVNDVAAEKYTIVTSELPVWLQPPIYFAPKKGKSGFSEGVTSRILLYVKERKQSSEPLIPLFVSIERIKNSTTCNKFDISFREFAWNLDNVAPNGDRPINFFSLGERCLAKVADQAQIEMSLVNEYSVASPTDLQKSNSFRDHSLQIMLQNQLGIPVPFIYDLQSKYVESKGPNSKSHIALAFRYSEHLDTRVIPTYAGMALLKGDENRSKKVSSPIGCYFEALHHGNRFKFAYSEDDKSCVLGVTEESLESVDVDSISSVPTYKIQLKSGSSLVSIDHLQDRIELKPQENLMGKAVKFPLTNGGFLTYKFDRANIQRSNRRRLKDADNGDAIDTSKIVGFGLSPEDELNNRLWSIPSSYNSFARCQAICVADPECRSFSYCIKAGVINCVTSSASFRTRSVLQELNSKRKAKPKIGSTTYFRTDSGGDVMLEWRPTCELHNKDYMRFMSEPTVDFHDWDLQNIVLAADNGREQCAKMCLEQNIKSMRISSRQENIREFFSNKGYCTYLYYTPLTDSVLEQIGGKRGSAGATSGLCSFSGIWFYQNGDGLNVSATLKSLSTEVYRFQFESLYEKQHGVYLKKSQKTKEQSAIYERLRTFKPVTEEERKLMIDFVESGSNSKEVSHLEVKYCAHTCLLQVNGPWPSCESFDMLEVVTDRGKRLLCRQNSITLNDARASGREDIVGTENPSARDHVIHYEPLFHVRSNASELAFPVRHVKMSRSDGPRWFTLMLMIGVASGVVLGVYMAMYRPINLRNWGRRESMTQPFPELDAL